MESLRILLCIIELVAMLACAGTLVDITRDLKKESIKLHERGLMQLGPFSRELEGRPVKRSAK